MYKIKCGAIKLLGRVGECQPPRVVMPLTVEPSKPRLCHDERYINLWIKDLPFRFLYRCYGFVFCIYRQRLFPQEE